MTTPQKPDKPCHICKSSKFWLRDKGYGKPEWLCQTCHPCPYIENITWYEVEREDNE